MDKFEIIPKPSGIQKIICEAGIVFDFRPVDKNPLMVQDRFTASARHYKVRIHRGNGAHFETYYSIGVGLAGPPLGEDLLLCLINEASFDFTSAAEISEQIGCSYAEAVRMQKNQRKAAADLDAFFSELERERLEDAAREM